MKMYEIIDKILRQNKNNKHFVKDVTMQLIDTINSNILLEIINNRRSSKELTNEELTELGKIIGSSPYLNNSELLTQTIDEKIQLLKEGKEEEDSFLPLYANPESFSEYQMNKYNWLKHSTYSFNSKKNFWLIMKNYVSLYEEKKRKDLYDFTPEDIKETINFINTTNNSTKKSVFSCIKLYIKWSIENGITSNTKNPCDEVYIDEILNFNKETIRETYQTLDEFYEWLDKIRANDIEKMVIVLFRYGVECKDMVSLRWENVDISSKKLIVVREKSEGNSEILKLPIDDRFIDRVNRAKECKVCVTQKGEPLTYKDWGYIIKTSDKSSFRKASPNNLYARISKIGANNKITISKKILTLNRYFDLVLNYIKGKNEIEKKDIIDIMETFGLKVNKNSYFKFTEQMYDVLSIKALDTRFKANKSC